jgi:hypothetical protein
MARGAYSFCLSVLVAVGGSSENAGEHGIYHRDNSTFNIIFWKFSTVLIRSNYSCFQLSIKSNKSFFKHLGYVLVDNAVKFLLRVLFYDHYPPPESRPVLDNPAVGAPTL